MSEPSPTLLPPSTTGEVPARCSSGVALDECPRRVSSGGNCRTPFDRIDPDPSAWADPCDPPLTAGEIVRAVLHNAIAGIYALPTRDGQLIATEDLRIAP